MYRVHCFVNFLGAENVVFLLTCVPAFRYIFFLCAFDCAQSPRKKDAAAIRAKTTVCLFFSLYQIKMFRFGKVYYLFLSLNQTV